MTIIITVSVANGLKRAVERFRNEVPAPVSGEWKSMGNGELWAAVLGQIAVVGSANSGDLLKAELGHEHEQWYLDLRELTGATRRKEIHRRMRRAGVRYVTADSGSCRKTTAAAYDFELLEVYGGPRQYFKNLASIPVESWRIGVVSDEMVYIRSKGARDLLIGLGLVESAVALDSRLQTVLERLGAKLPADLATNRVKYKSLEQELLTKICQPCAISGGHLDRILFNRWTEVA